MRKRKKRYEFSHIKKCRTKQKCNCIDGDRRLLRLEYCHFDSFTSIQSFFLRAMNYGCNEGKGDRNPNTITKIIQELTNQMEWYIHHLQYLYRRTHAIIIRLNRHFNSGKWRWVKQQQSNKHLVTLTASQTSTSAIDQCNIKQFPLCYCKCLFSIWHITLLFPRNATIS